MLIVLNYLVIGAFIMFAMEVWINPHKEEIGEIVNEEEEEFKFDWVTRIFNIILWPITLAIILKHLIEWVKNILK